MKDLSFLLLALPLLCSGQTQTQTFSVDSVGRQNWQITTITTFVRADSTVYETRASERFRNRKEAAKHVREVFAERIRADSARLEDTKRGIALLKTSRLALLSDLGRGPGGNSGKSAEIPVVLPPEPQNPKKKKKKH